MIDLQRAIGLNGRRPADDNENGTGPAHAHRHELTRLVNLQLAASGLPTAAPGGGGAGGAAAGDGRPAAVAEALLANYREKTRLLEDYRCPADRRIEAFLATHLADLDLPEPLRLPGQTLVLDRHGLARELSLPAGGDEYVGPLVSSYRLRNGVLHNPKSDRRTTAGTFHVAEGGLPVPFDKKAVPKRVFAELFRRAIGAPEDVMRLPFYGGAGGDAKPQAAGAFVSLLLRPVVCPEVPGVCSAKTMETRFFSPGSLVSNLDFVESIFGNAGDPYLPENDAGLDVEHWTGHTGCVVLAPHLVDVTKQDAGLPHESRATERQKRDGMCWREPSEKYNDGRAFKLTCRTDAGVIVTLIADNYYGYCKKEVKTQLSYAANLYGNVEEEHAGGAVAFPSYNLGDEFQAISQRLNGRTFADVARDYTQWIDVRPEGYGVDKARPDLLYVPEDALFSLPAHRITWKANGKEQSIPLLAGKIYMTPSGYKVRIDRHPGAPSWRLIGTVGDGTVCHKPCTVSGGGKSEISKSITDYMLYGPIFVADIEKDLDLVQQIFARDYSTRWKKDGNVKPDYASERSRPILSPKRSLGSVIKLLTPSAEYTDEYNRWLASIPSHIYPVVFIIKRFQRPEWAAEDPQGADWRRWFGVDIVNGYPGNELKFGTRKLVGTYLRVGLLGERDWRTFKVRQDFAAAAKVQVEDDITASVVVPGHQLSGLRAADPRDVSYKFVTNCEYRLFQRPDDAVHRGLDKQTELDLSRGDNFISNFEPLRRADAQALVDRAAEFDQFTAPMQKLLRAAARGDGEDGGGAGKPRFVVSSAHPRIVDGKPTKNPRYLQLRPDLDRPLDRYVAERGVRLFRGIPADKPVHQAVDAVLMGRRNNPPDAPAGIRALAVYNPIHYQELPELFMDFVCSLTGKSPSTTGAGSEGALTKGPFNAVRPAADLNNALVSFVLTGLGGFSTAAGHIGPRVRVDHDVSLLVPEIWCRLTPRERDPAYLIGEGYLEAVKDFEHGGETIHASRLGYRITEAFVRAFFGRVFDNPSKVFEEAILKPETQDLECFADGVKNVCEAQQRVARQYFEDGSVRELCPPLKVLMSILAFGSHDGMTAHHTEVRRLFTREHLLASDWYRERLHTKQRRDVALWRRHREYLTAFLARPTYAGEAKRLGIDERLRLADAELKKVNSPAYLGDLVGALGAHPFS